MHKQIAMSSHMDCDRPSLTPVTEANRLLSWIYCVIENNDTDTIVHLFEFIPELFYANDFSQMSTIHYMIVTEHYDIINLLIQHNADILRPVDKKGNSLFDYSHICYKIARSILDQNPHLLLPILFLPYDTTKLDATIKINKYLQDSCKRQNILHINYYWSFYMDLLQGNITLTHDQIHPLYSAIRTGSSHDIDCILLQPSGGPISPIKCGESEYRPFDYAMMLYKTYNNPLFFKIAMDLPSEL